MCNVLLTHRRSFLFLRREGKKNYCRFHLSLVVSEISVSGGGGRSSFTCLRFAGGRPLVGVDCLLMLRG